MAPAHPLPTCASAKEVAAAEAAEEVAWKGLLAPEAASPASKSSTPRKRRRKDVEQVQKQEKREQDNLIGKLCKCGLVDEDKFMLQCDGCDVWFHGACVGVTQAQADRAKSWCCWRCAKKRNAASARTQRYCHCRGPWDGHAFMIACDSCDVWYHGACVGLRADSLQQGVEAAFRRDKVQQQVQRHGYEVDAIGEHGKALFARQFHMPLFGHANGFSTSLQAQVNTTGL